MAKSANEALLIQQKDTIAQLNMTIKAQADLIASLQKSVDEQTLTIKNLNEQIEYLTKKLFGTSSEKSKACEGQLSFFNEAELETTEDILSETIEVKSYKRKSKRTHDELFDKLPHREEVVHLSENERICNTCGTKLEPIGKKFVRHEFRYTPAKGEVVDIYVETYKCPKCCEGYTPDEESKIVSAAAPNPLIQNSYASESSVAWTMYQKYSLALPLYRQEQYWAQLGVELNRATLANWIIRCAYDYFQPLYEFFHRKLMEREFLMADETRLQVLKEPNRAAESDSFMWLFRSGEDGLPPIILYHYTETRAKFNAVQFLAGFSGYLETDGYQGYNNLPNVKRCTCWSHLRRYFVDAIPKGKSTDYSLPAVQAVAYCDKLFHYERKSKELGHNFEQRKAYRIKKELPVIESFYHWLDQQYPDKGSRLEKAVNYAQNRKDDAMTYLEDGRCSFHNNLSENAIRPFTVGRKNFLFSDTPKGATASALCYTMVEMAKSCQIGVYQYLSFVLSKRPSAEWKDDQFETIAPWNKDVQDACIES